jgi:8-oxo-dGTP pyrophosphatase MutT (NUDIX family)
MTVMEPKEPGGAIAARAAATIVVARSATDRAGIEVLMLRRAATNRFVPGFVVFPGGAIDPGDAELARRWFGEPAEAARACAVRELAEEAGLLLSAQGVVEARSAPTGWSSPPAIERLPEIGRWIAPDFLPTRFDARFFAARFDGVARPQPDGHEADAAWFARPGDLLEGHQQGSVQLAWPTFKTLEALAGCSSVEEVLALHVEQVATLIPSHVAPRPPRPESHPRGAGPSERIDE